MRRSEFIRAVDDEFGVRASSIVQDLYLPAVGMTAIDALAAGIAPREIWLSLCHELEIPESRRHGAGRINHVRDSSS